jgi:hypothetical protein
VSGLLEHRRRARPEHHHERRNALQHQLHYSVTS